MSDWELEEVKIVKSLDYLTCGSMDLIVTITNGKDIHILLVFSQRISIHMKKISSKAATTKDYMSCIATYFLGS